MTRILHTPLTGESGYVCVCTRDCVCVSAYVYETKGMLSVFTYLYRQYCEHIHMVDHVSHSRTVDDRWVVHARKYVTPELCTQADVRQMNCACQYMNTWLMKSARTQIHASCISHVRKYMTNDLCTDENTWQMNCAQMQNNVQMKSAPKQIHDWRDIHRWIHKQTASLCNHTQAADDHCNQNKQDCRLH